MTIKLITLYLSLLTMSGIAQGNIKTKNYETADFNSIVTQGGGNLNITYSDKHTLEVNTTDDCFGLIEIAVSSKTLCIEIKKSKTNTCNCTINIGVPVFHELVQNGGGNIIVKRGFSPTNSFECQIKAGGNIDLSELSVDSLYASIEGGGKIRLNVLKKLEGNISGGGLIEYLGNPTVKSNISGGGTIRKQ